MSSCFIIWGMNVFKWHFSLPISAELFWQYWCWLSAGSFYISANQKNILWKFFPIVYSQLSYACLSASGWLIPEAHTLPAYLLWSRRDDNWNNSIVREQEPDLLLLSSFQRLQHNLRARDKIDCKWNLRENELKIRPAARHRELKIWSQEIGVGTYNFLWTGQGNVLISKQISRHCRTFWKKSSRGG